MKIARVVMEPRGGDSPYGWGADAYLVKIGVVTVDCTPLEPFANEIANRLNEEINRVIKAKQKGSTR